LARELPTKKLVQRTQQKMTEALTGVKVQPSGSDFVET